MRNEAIETLIRNKWPNLLPFNPITADEVLFSESLLDFVTEVIEHQENTNRRLYELEKRAEVFRLSRS